MLNNRTKYESMTAVNNTKYVEGEDRVIKMLRLADSVEVIIFSFTLGRFSQPDFKFNALPFTFS